MWQFSVIIIGALCSTEGATILTPSEMSKLDQHSEVNLLSAHGPELQREPSPIPAPAFLMQQSDFEASEESRVISSSVVANGDNRTNALTRTINQILENYDKRIRPDFHGPPVEVGVTIMVKGFSAVSEVDMEFGIDFYLRQYWNDSRLKFDLQPRVDVIGLTYEFSHQIWHPDTFFPNEKRSYIHSATVKNEFIRLSPDGQILKSVRLTLTATCPMDLQYFPMDQQICSVELGAYGSSTTQVGYVWKTDEGPPVRMGLNSVTLPQFQILGHRERNTTSRTSTGNYSILCVEFLFVRSLNYYLSQFYIPADLIVVISWFSLWMGRDAAAERMALGVTTVLTITTLLLSTNSNSPKISYVKAIDVYLGVCFALVFGSLLQSAAIGYLSKRFRARQVKQDRLEDKHLAYKKSIRVGRKQDAMVIKERNSDVTDEEVDDDDDLSRSPTIIEMEYTAAKEKVKQSKSLMTKLDIISRIAFPLGFSIFNIFYWSYYLSVSKLPVDDSWQSS